MKRLLALVIMTCLCWLGASGVAVAHTLKIDGTIGVTLHINPDDEPIQGQSATMSLDIHDTAGRFNPLRPADCSCTLKITQNGKAIGALSITDGNSYPPLSFTFPESGSYNLRVTGKPRDGGDFQPFDLTFETYVRSAVGDVEAGHSSNKLQTYLPIVFAVGGAMLVLLWIEPFKRREKP